MRKYGLIGYPLGHSFSKKYFAGKFAAENISDCSYENYPLLNLKDFPKLVNDNPMLCGLNVTIPHKTGILRFIDVKEPAVSDIGAANVLKFRRSDGKVQIYGYNSDITGIEDSLRPFITARVKQALILGTGGSSRAVMYVMKKLGIQAALVSRERRKEIFSYQDITDEILYNTQLIINTTPLGMYPGISSKPDINYIKLNENHILFDLVYNPEITSFLRMGKERGCSLITGLKMLYSQAERSWEIWNDDRF
jgi:shikimate dehydrogenase